MDNFWIATSVLAGFTVAMYAAKIIDLLIRRARLGAALFRRGGANPWYAWTSLLIGIYFTAKGIYSQSAEDLIIGILLVPSGFGAFFPVGRLRVHENGVQAGLLVLRWEEITNWEWSPATGAPRGGQLHLWTTSAWRFFYVPRPSRALQTGVRFDDELHAVLEARAPLRRRAEPCP